GRRRAARPEQRQGRPPHRLCRQPPLHGHGQDNLPALCPPQALVRPLPHQGPRREYVPRLRLCRVLQQHAYAHLPGQDAPHAV
ncbi:hypothetical protein BN1723_020434, partial [Verticillium longisporum]